MISIKSGREIEKMKATCKLASDTLCYIEQFIKPGVSTLELNDICHEYILKHDAYPSPLNYNGFPKSVCTTTSDLNWYGFPSKTSTMALVGISPFNPISVSPVT